MPLSLSQLDVIRECSKDAAAFERLRALYETLNSPRAASPTAANSDYNSKANAFSHLQGALPTKLLDAMQDMFSISSTDGTIQYASPSHQRVLGYPIERIIGSKIFDYVHPDDLPKILEHYQHALENGSSDQVEFRCRHADGHYVWLQTSGDLLYDEAGQISGALFVSRDISERKQMEADLRESESRLRMLTDNVNDMLSMVKPDGTILYVSPSHERALGYPPDYYNRHTLLEHLHPDDAAGAFAWLRDVYTGKSISPQTFIYRYRHADGDYRWLEAGATVIRDQAGAVDRVIIVTRDITARKAAEAELQEKQHFIERVANASPYMIYVFDVDTQMNIYNNRATRLFYNLSIEEMRYWQEERIAANFHPDDLQRASAMYQQLLKAPDNTVVEEQLRMARHDGAWRWMHLWLVVFKRRADGSVQQILGLCMDITEQRESQEIRIEHEHLRAAFLKEQELSDLKTRMMRRISHEFRTPLAVINAAAEMLDIYGERHTPQQRVERYQQIYASVEHMTAMLNDMSFIIKDLTRTRSINSLPVQMSSLCETLITSLRPQLDIQHPLNIEAEADLNPVAGDPELLEHALTHLLKNAINYSPNKTPIYLKLQRRDHYLVLTVRDEGIGILQHEQERVFEPFFRGSNIPESMGLGLGLTIAQKIIEAHGGSLVLKSKIGSGTTVSIYLPSL